MKVQAIAILMLVLIVPIAVAAQDQAVLSQMPATTFEELRRSQAIGIGDTIRIIDARGAAYKARTLQFSDRLSVMTSAGVVRDFTEFEVREIRHRHVDPVWNGLLIGTGFGIGAGVALGTGEACESGKCVASGILVFSGIGAGIGVAIDFAINRQEIVYSNSRLRGECKFHHCLTGEWQVRTCRSGSDAMLGPKCGHHVSIHRGKRVLRIRSRLFAAQILQRSREGLGGQCVVRGREREFDTYCRLPVQLLFNVP